VKGWVLVHLLAGVAAVLVQLVSLVLPVVLVALV
jgi:hypothetical protein